MGHKTHIFIDWYIYLIKANIFYEKVVIKSEKRKQA